MTPSALIALLSEATTLEEIANVRAITYALCRSHYAVIDDNDPQHAIMDQSAIEAANAALDSLEDFLYQEVNEAERNIIHPIPANY